MNNEQNHPLYITDRDLINRLLGKTIPEDEDFIDLARLLIRYEGFPGANDLQIDMAKLLDLWGITRKQLNSKTNEIWSNGYRPGASKDEVVGSGFDTSDNLPN